VFGSAGRLVDNKGYDVAIRALAGVRASGVFGERGFRYRIAGVGPARGKLAGLACELGLQDAIEFVGWLEYSDLPSFYHSVDVFLHPATWDPYPVVVLEAMASGLPVIGSDGAGSVVDRIQDGVNGLVFPRGDPSALARKILWLVDHWELVRDMGRLARRTAEEWSAERICKEMLSVLTSF